MHTCVCFPLLFKRSTDLRLSGSVSARADDSWKCTDTRVYSKVSCMWTFIDHRRLLWVKSGDRGGQ